MLILKTLGSQQDEDLSFLTDENAIDYVTNISNPEEKSKFQKLFPNSDPELIKLLAGLL